MALPGPLSAPDAWDTLLPTAQRLAELCFDANVLDEERNALGRQRVAQYRDELRARDRKQEGQRIRPGWWRRPPVRKRPHASAILASQPIAAAAASVRPMPRRQRSMAARLASISARARDPGSAIPAGPARKRPERQLACRANSTWANQSDRLAITPPPRP